MIYQKDGDFYVHGDLRFPEFGVAYDTVTWTLLQHGPAHGVRDWYFAAVRKARGGPCPKYADTLACRSSREWTAEQIDDAISRPEGLRRLVNSEEGFVPEPPEEPALPSMEDKEFVGTIEWIRYNKGGFLVAQVQEPGPDGKDAVVKGGVDEAEVIRGLTYRFMGRWQQHEKHGLQFAFTTFTRDVPHSRNGLVSYLARTVPGVGKITAGRLWDAFGVEAAEVLLNDPDQVVRSGVLTREQALKAQESLREDKVFARTKIDLLTLMDGRGLPLNVVIEAALREWGIAAPEKIRKDPFCLLEAGIPGCGFGRVDRLYRELGGDLDSPLRKKWAAWWAVHCNRDGHTWVSRETVAETVNKELSDETGRVARTAITVAIKAGLLEEWVEQIGDGIPQSYLSTVNAAVAERVVARRILDLMATRDVLWPDVSKMPELTPHQAEKYTQATRRSVAMLCGVPGSGKTFMTAAIVRCILAAGLRIGIACPTGRAAVRVTELLRENKVNGINASTVHSMLRVQFTRTGEFTFVHNEQNALNYDVIILDEFSMAGTGLLAAFLKAVRPGTNVLFVGDPYQLPPVERGAPFRDLLLTQAFPRGELTEIHRNSGAIVRACRAIKNRQPFDFSTKFDPDNGDNLLLVECSSPDKIQAAMRAFIQKQKQKPDARWDLFDEMQAITILNNGTPASRRELNRVLQEEMNPLGLQVQGNPFRVGDKIISLKNSGQPVLLPPRNSPPADYEGYRESRDDAGDLEKVFVANGDLGRVLAVSPGFCIVRFNDRLVRVRVRAEDAEEEGDFALGYCVTTHKFQGSQSKCILFAADSHSRARFIASRELLYTALSRGEQLTVVYGKKETLEEWTRRTVVRHRKTRLRELLEENLAPPLEDDGIDWKSI